MVSAGTEKKRMADAKKRGRKDVLIGLGAVGWVVCTLPVAACLTCARAGDIKLLAEIPE